MNRVRARRTRAAVLAAMVGLGVAALMGPAANAAEPWGFEQVTPVDKSGTEPMVNRSASANHDGSALMYSTMASIASLDPRSAPYTPAFSASRTTGGWANRSLEIDIAPETPSTAIWSTVGAISEDHTRTIVYSRAVLAPGGVAGGLNIYRHDVMTGEYRFIAGDPAPSRYSEVVMMAGSGTGMVLGATPRLERVVLYTSFPLDDAAGAHAADRGYIYQWDEQGGLELASRLDDEDGTPMYSAVGRLNGVVDPRNPNVLSADGEQIVLVSARQKLGVSFWEDNPEAGLFVRRGDETVPVSYSRLPGDDRTTRPVFDDSVVASPDGRFIVFRTSQNHRLSPDAPAENGQGFYLYDREQPEESQLRFVAADNAMAGNRPLQLADDGSALYFISQAVLAPGATTFSDNIYVWSDGEVRLIAKGRDWDQGGPYSLTYSYSGFGASPNGRYFAFTTAASVTGEDTSNPDGCEPPPASAEPAGWCREVYLHDAETDTTVCASCVGEDHRSRGHAGMGPAEMYSTMLRARPLVSDDGDVYFDTPNRLLPGDDNGARDVYAYRDGQHRLVSRATPATHARLLTLSGDRESVFIVTNDQLVGQDRDHLDDVYLTRAGAGLASQNPPPPRPGCEGSSCRGASPAQGALPVAGTLAFAGTGNVKEPRRARLSVARLKAVRGVVARLVVRVPAAGRIAVSGRSVRGARVLARKKGRYRVRVALTAKAKRKLARRGRLRLNVRVTFRTADGGPATRRVGLTFRAPLRAKGGR